MGASGPIKHGGSMGTSARVVRRKQLKKPRRLTDEELLADAMTAALKWKRRGS